MKHGLNAWGNYSPPKGVPITTLKRWLTVALCGAAQIVRRKCALEIEGINGIVDAAITATLTSMTIADIGQEFGIGQELRQTLRPCIRRCRIAGSTDNHDWCIGLGLSHDYRGRSGEVFTG